MLNANIIKKSLHILTESIKVLNMTVLFITRVLFLVWLLAYYDRSYRPSHLRRQLGTVGLLIDASAWNQPSDKYEVRMPSFENCLDTITEQCRL